MEIKFGLQIPNLDDPDLGLDDDEDFEEELRNIDKSTGPNRNARKKDGQRKPGNFFSIQNVIQFHVWPFVSRCSRLF